MSELLGPLTTLASALLAAAAGFYATRRASRSQDKAADAQDKTAESHSWETLLEQHTKLTSTLEARLSAVEADLANEKRRSAAVEAYLRRVLAWASAAAKDPASIPPMPDDVSGHLNP